MTELFVSGLVGWLIQEACGASIRRFSDRVSRALQRVIRDAVRRAVRRIYADDEQHKRTVALLLERRAVDLPLVDGTPMAQLDLAVREWVASLEHPVGEDGRLSAIGDHPLVDALREEILEGIHDEATRGDGVLHPLWDDVCWLQLTPPLLTPEGCRYFEPGQRQHHENALLANQSVILLVCVELHHGRGIRENDHSRPSRTSSASE